MATKDELEAALNDEFTRRVALEEQVKNLKAQLSEASDTAYLRGELIDDLEQDLLVMRGRAQAIKDIAEGMMG